MPSCRNCAFWSQYLIEGTGMGECGMISMPETRVSIIIRVMKDGVAEPVDGLEGVLVDLVTPGDFSCEAWQKNERVS